MKADSCDTFRYPFRSAGLTDVGRERESNQDAVILCPELGFFAVSDGMGGLPGGHAAAEYVAQSVPRLMSICAEEYRNHRDMQAAARSFLETVGMMSDRLYTSGNSRTAYTYGATFAGCWLLEDRAVIVSLGDSRVYLLPKYKKQLQQITEDQNMAGLLVRCGELSPEEAASHPGSSQLTAFVGMESPAEPRLYVEPIAPGDRILLCSDGLYGMVEGPELVRLLRSGRSPEPVCRRLVQRANEKGGRDNISAAYIRVLS